VAALLVAAALGTAGPAPAGAAAPVAQPGPPIPTAGPLFFPSLLGLGPTLRLPHYCSGSVVHSASRDLVLTAAHCVFGTGLATEFAPGFADGATPFGVWTVTRAYVDRRWLTAHDPAHDVALLRVAPRHGRRIEDVTGGVPLGGAPAAGTPVTVTGYLAGSGGRPLACSAPVYYTDAYPSIDCAGLADGVSGGPWVAGGRLVGATGGLEQGGCTPDTSYSAPFGPDTAALLARAAAGGAGDFVLPALGDGC